MPSNDQCDLCTHVRMMSVPRAADDTICSACRRALVTLFMLKLSGDKDAELLIQKLKERRQKIGELLQKDTVLAYARKEWGLQ